MLEAGSLFGRYQIISSLGFGGMGEVYLAADDKLARKVAIKILSEKIGDDDDRLHRFRREAIAASALNHPNILTVYDVGEVDGSHYIASEFVDGHTIRHLLSGRRKNIRDILSILTQVADALTCAHAAGIVHRDIKPENIMERRDGWVKVLDFGLAKVFSGQRFIADSSAKTLSKHDTARGMMIGTAAYMSPEQARGGKVDERSDVWSLGVVLFELL
ncbi:MAG: serine/threonine protein kinase, partial [Acidobacteria bacterium]|nr:serine/threonine protein kinase [Acidobacteriota bacterium]